jgi:hypothetical protein
MTTNYRRAEWRRNTRGDNPDSRHFDSGFGVSAWNDRNSDGSLPEPKWTLTDWAILAGSMLTLALAVTALMWGIFRG